AGGAAVAKAQQATPVGWDRRPLTYVAITPCGLMDTRAGSGLTGDFGPPALLGDSSQGDSVARKVPVQNSACGVPSAAAYALELAVVPPRGGSVGWLASWPDDQPWPGKVVLTAPAGAIVSNTVIVASGADGGIQVSATDPTDLVIDIN